MPVSRRTRAFTLIETMIVVALIGILAVVATVAYRRWILSSYLNEAQGMLMNFRSAEEAFRAENGGYVNVAGLPPSATLYPFATPTGSVKTEWGGTCTGCAGWQSLNIKPDGPVHFGYAIMADNTGVTAPPSISAGGVSVSLATMKGQPWFIAEAVCDVDDDATTPSTTIYAISADNMLRTNNAGQ
jgi:prepilin-type N-terminal cleavage/methylation domain-containing protein